MIALSDTDSAGIAAEFVRARTRAGSPAMGMVLTMVIVADEDQADTAMEMAREASHEHPARVLGVILGDGRGASQVDAQVGTGSGWTGETALIRLTGEVVKHPDSVVLPLLLPDSPVAVWWPTDPPADPAEDPLGKLAQRRITDSANVSRGRSGRAAQPVQGLHAGQHRPRLDPADPVAGAAGRRRSTSTRSRSPGPRSPPSGSTRAPTCSRRGCATGSRSRSIRKTSKGPGITAVEMETAQGPIRISRPDGRLATYSSPGHPDRPIALRRRDVHELLSEELRRLDEDDVYAAVAKTLTKSRSL